MLCVKPATDTEFEKSILKNCTITGKEPRLLTATQDGELLGYIAVDLVKGKENIIDFNISGCENYDHPTGTQHEIADYLIRAAGNYAMNRGVIVLSTQLAHFYTLFKLFGFTEIDNNLTIHLKVLFKKCENCSKQ